ncbi:MAG: hypothetical protein WEB33_12535 [Bacteroidota bacterium]
MTRCDRCGQSLVSPEVDCAFCGRLGPNGNGVGCELHEGADAVALCFVCGKPMCGDCAVWAGSKFLCDLPAHREIAGAWEVIARCSSIFEADMITKNLEQGGLRSIVFSPEDFTVSFWHPGLSSARVFVRKEDAEMAGGLLESLALLGKP